MITKKDLDKTSKKKASSHKPTSRPEYIPALEQYNKTGHAEITTNFGTTRACRGWGGQPRISSRAGDYGGAKVGTTYSSIISALQSSKRPDPEIAKRFLKQNATGLSQRERRGYAMMDSTVNVAEAYREPRAPKIHRSVLRSIEKGESHFSDYKKNFAMAQSVQAGREQADHVFQYRDPDAAPSRPASPRTQMILDNMSPTPSDNMTPTPSDNMTPTPSDDDET